jgi:uncharacterized protein
MKAAWRWVFRVLVLGVLSAFPADARSQPSFDCRKAGNATEKRICADPELARLDRHLATLWRGMIRSFSDQDQVAQIKADQKSWIAGRNDCGDDSKCIADRYQAQIKRFSGDDPDYPAAGVFSAERTGTFALYPLSGKYLVAIATSDPSNGAWTCDMTGSARKEGTGLRVSSGDLSFPATLRDAKTLVVEQSREVRAVARNQCGMNGTFAFTFTREAPKEAR